MTASGPQSGRTNTEVQRKAPPTVPLGPGPEADLNSARVRPLWPVLCFFATFFLYIAFIPRLLLYSSPPTGDQAFYLMVTTSIVEDLDLNVANQYANREEHRFYDLAPHPPGFVGMDAPFPLPLLSAFSSNRPPTEWYDFRGPGLPVMMAPAWLVGSWFSLWWPATVVMMCLIAALTITNVFLLAHELTGRTWIAAAVAVPMALSNPIMSYSMLIFSELPTALLIIYAFRRIALGWSENNRFRLLLVGLCIGYIPWLAWRCVPIAAMLFLYAAVQWRRYYRTVHPPRRSLLGTGWLLIPVVLSALLMSWYNVFLFGTILPPNKVPELGNAPPFHWPWEGGDALAGFASHAFGLLFDRQMGLLIYAPYLLLAAVGCIAMFRSVRAADRRLFFWLAAVILPYYFLLSSYVFWNGLWNPPARFQTVFVPLLAAPLAMSLFALRGSLLYKIIYGLLALPGFGFMAIMMADPRLLWPNVTLFTWLAESPQSPLRIDLRPLIPSFPPQLSARDELQLPAQSAGIIAAAVLVVLLCYFLMRSSPWIIRTGRLPYRVHALTWVGVFALVGLGWYVGNAPYLKHRTLLVRQNTWQLVPRVNDPHGITYLDGKIYVTDYRGGQVGELNLTSGAYGLINPVSANGPITFTHPGDIKVGPDNLLYVLNNGNNEQALFEMKPDGEVVKQVPLAGKSATGFGLGMWPAGNTVYATDMGRVLVYGPAGGAPKASWGGMSGGFNNVMGVAVGSDGTIYAAESSGQRVQQLDAAGHFVRSFELDCSPLYLASNGDWVDVSCSRGLVSINTRTGDVQRSMAADNDLPGTPAGIAYGPDGTLYMLDFGILVACKVQH
jgi:outer membrane protein assembly factor BamB